MPGDWWYDNEGLNMLKGVEGDPFNPPLLSDSLIVNILSTTPIARESFERMVINMLPEEQFRLRYLATTICYNLAPDPKEVEDHFQHIFNTTEIRVSGPRGGGNWAPPPMAEDHESG